jgi:membrane-bound lytic murein transglycosylase D
MLMKSFKINPIIIFASLHLFFSELSATPFSSHDTLTNHIDLPALDTNIIPPTYEAAFESLLHDMYVHRVMSDGCRRQSDTVVVTYSDSVYISRLQRLPYRIPMPYNSIVKSYIKMYAGRISTVEYMLGLGENYYFPIFEHALAKYDMPLELKYLPVIESALNPRAVSSAGAGGLWQFMVATGRIYNLEVNSLVDERCDPFKSSDAAARYLKDLYMIYNDWHLVIAAYNCGPGNVAKAIRYANSKRDYWSIYPYLPRETRGYVPIFIAANYIMNYYKEHNICLIMPSIHVAVDTMMVSDRVHLEQIADILKLPVDELRFLNPQYRHNIIPGNIKSYPLVLPVSLISEYQSNRDTILKHRTELVAQQTQVEPSGGQFGSANNQLIFYKVRAGDTLSGIARKYHTTVPKLKKWNGLKSNTIQIGKRLRIYR